MVTIVIDGVKTEEWPCVRCKKCGTVYKEKTAVTGRMDSQNPNKGCPKCRNLQYSYISSIGKELVFEGWDADKGFVFRSS